MARVRVTERFDDLTGEVIPEGEGQTVVLKVGSRAWSLDLMESSVDQLHQAIDPFIRNADVIKKFPSPVGKTTSSGVRKACRRWARDNGISVSERGNISGDIMAAFLESNPSWATSTPS